MGDFASMQEQGLYPGGGGGGTNESSGNFYISHLLSCTSLGKAAAQRLRPVWWFCQELVLAVPPILPSGPGPSFEAEDFQALWKWVDGFSLMTYDASR